MARKESAGCNDLRWNFFVPSFVILLGKVPTMKILHLLLAVFGVAACGALRAADTPAPLVDVVYVHPENFTDVKEAYVTTDRQRDEYLKELKENIQDEAHNYIPAGQHLVLNITDVDMAGEFEQWHGPRFDEVRIVRDIYPPRVNLEFKLTDATGKVIKQGERKITDIQFMDKPNTYFPDDPLRYEKKLLDDWFYDEFGPVKK
jgi:hypothetical protein